MAFVIDVSYTNTSEASTYIWRDASFKNIRDILPSFKSFTQNDLITNGNRHYLPTPADKKVRRLISFNGKRYEKDSGMFSVEGGNRMFSVYVDNLMENGQLNGTWKVEFYPKISSTKNSLYNLAAVKNSINNLFNFYIGERIILPQYGSVLPRIIGSSITDAQRIVIREQIEDMMRWEKRAVLNDIKIDMNPDEHEIWITIVYSVPELNNAIVSAKYSVKITDD